jgi:hypothetical protein
MREQPTYSIAVVCEADADRRTACSLADRVLQEAVEWIVPETIDLLRKYRGIHEHEPYLKWTNMKEIARRQRLVAHGFVGGEPRKPDAAMAERALRLLATHESPPSAVILTRDMDQESQRREGFEQARRAGNGWPFAIVVGVADTKRECWHLAGYEPRDAEEQERLDRERQVLGFDPRSAAEQLTASEKGARRDAKRVLDALTGGERRREDACVEEPPLALLAQRGASTGLAAYLLEIEERLIPIFEPTTRH